MSDAPNRSRGNPVVILEPSEIEEYQRSLTYLEHQVNLVKRAEAALDEARFVMQCVDNERIRIWQEICKRHNLDPDSNYEIDTAGRIFTGPEQKGT